jgi:predicted RNase H-like HicB family nuclease
VPPQELKDAFLLFLLTLGRSRGAIVFRGQMRRVIEHAQRLGSSSPRVSASTSRLSPCRDSLLCVAWNLVQWVVLWLKDRASRRNDSKVGHENIHGCVEWDPETNVCVGIVPGIPGAQTQGATLDELHSNLKEVLESCLEELEGEIKDLPRFAGLQRIEVALRPASRSWTSKQWKRSSFGWALYLSGRKGEPRFLSPSRGRPRSPAASRG